MTEHVQVREGVWRTRDGREIVISLRDFGDAEPTSFVWCSKSTGEYETWRDDGRNTLSKFPQPLDLVEFLRPLPGTETTTEQLAEIEAGMAEIESDVAELVQQDEACRLQAELVLVTAERETLRADLTEVASERDALVCEINEATAARDNLQQQLATMTYERDILAQRLMTKPSEDSLQKQVGKQQIEINTLKDQLQDMTGDRDQSARELLRVTADRDNLLQLRDRLQETLREQRQAIESARAVQQQLAAMTSDRDRLAGELANAQQLAADLRGEVDFVRTQKAAQEHQLRAAIARLQRELQQARIDLEAERQVVPGEIAINDAAFSGFNKGKTWAFREVHNWLRPFAGAGAKDAAALLDAVPGLVKRLAQCEGVEI
jgi:uncharacterized coiled-coil DUF342 family protein